MVEARVVWVTVPNEEVAVRVGRAVVEERLAACVTVIPGVRSIYRWQGAIHDEPELQLLIKTEARHLSALHSRVVALHGYEVPEFLALPVEVGSERYLNWIHEQVGP